jgi:ISXO2-like transposase domain
MCRRLREAVRDFTVQLGGEGKMVEIDETFVDGLEKNKHRSKRGTGGVGRQAVFSLVERHGKVRSHHIPAVSADNLRPIVEAQIHGATYVMTDEGGAAKKVGSEFTQHGSVNHGAGECVRGNIRTKTVESYSSIMKRDLLDVSLRQPATFEANLAEFDFR